MREFSVESSGSVIVLNSGWALSPPVKPSEAARGPLGAVGHGWFGVGRAQEPSSARRPATRSAHLPAAGHATFRLAGSRGTRAQPAGSPSAPLRRGARGLAAHGSQGFPDGPRLAEAPRRHFCAPALCSAHADPASTDGAGGLGALSTIGGCGAAEREELRPSPRPLPSLPRRCSVAPPLEGAFTAAP